MHEQTAASVEDARAGLVGYWTLFTVLGETLAHTLIGLSGTLLSAAFGTPDRLPPPVVLSAIMVLVGALEGVSVGALQWVVLRRVVPDLKAPSFIVANAAAFAAAWAAGMASDALEPSGMPSHAVLLAIAAGSGLALGAIVGIGQWIALRPHVRRAGLWPLANAVGWALGLFVAGVGALLMPSETKAATSLALGMASGAATGAAVGLVTGPVLSRLTRA